MSQERAILVSFLELAQLQLKDSAYDFFCRRFKVSQNRWRDGYHLS